ncbi:hypothetical protein BJ912DRAFT_1059430 [Pholiota molesta]|nr:hypothetical protein BJ912DRAFT_1059430 [Pholiota molesta]
MSVITYDDRDPIIHYSSGWSPGSNPGDVDGTSTFTTTTGSTATITFTGVQISVYGTIPIVTPKTTSSYSIDGTYIFQQQFYQSPILSPDTPHTLVVTYAVDSGTQFFIDFMKVVPADSTSNPPSSPGTTATSTQKTTIQQTTTASIVIPPSSPTSTHASTNATTTSINLASTATTTTSTSGTSSSPLAASEATTTSPTVPVNKSSSPSTGLIAGSVIGGLAVVLLGIGLWLLWRVHMRRRNRPISTAPTLSPFPLVAGAIATPDAAGPPSSETASYYRALAAKKGPEPVMAQQDHASVSHPQRHSNLTMLDQPPPEYER